MAEKIVGVRFKRAESMCYFSNTKKIDLEVGDLVVAETERGLNVGKVMKIHESSLSEPLKPILRKAEKEDLRQIRIFESKERDLLEECAELVAKRNLPMKLLAAEYSLDKSYLTFYFRSGKRIDFRALLRDLSATFRTRIELRQVGARDEAKILGYFGRCGRPLCCMTFLTKFESISMKMAKDQGLPLNPDRVSGVCGRLLCCLNYEEERYLEIQKNPDDGNS